MENRHLVVTFYLLAVYPYHLLPCIYTYILILSQEGSKSLHLWTRINSFVIYICMSEGRKEFGKKSFYHMEGMIPLYFEVFGKDCLLPSRIAWVPR